MSGGEAEGGATRVAAAALLRAAARGEACGGPCLVVREAGAPARQVALGDELTVGRGPAAALRLADAGVSRLHARFQVGPAGEVTVEDLGSKNGVRQGGRILGRGPWVLAPGDAVVMGATTLALALADRPPAGAAGAGEAAPPATPEGGAGGAAEDAAVELGPRRTRGILLCGAALLLAAAGALLATGG